jgi:hypothetical protein
MGISGKGAMRFLAFVGMTLWSVGTTKRRDVDNCGEKWGQVAFTVDKWHNARAPEFP